ncbi:hypothetical protein Q9R08_00865 [Microbacterium sp. QXD-8]|uniref:Uncharacterized protein n=1 Tax=Microbacterium psychrotolerans TaxID=3068321 RepID=A0ABU0YW34_9MICO|nr:hypothetical protein [Microbacterium sp. QXD-8]MDQ7876517.1 hypothetical protein [Microbacterium sp. QXD-8]
MGKILLLVDGLTYELACEDVDVAYARVRDAVGGSLEVELTSGELRRCEIQEQSSWAILETT